MRCPALVLGLLSLVAGCGFSPLSPQAKLADAAYDMNTASRFGRMDLASEHVGLESRVEFAKKHAAWGRSIRVVDMEFSDIGIREKGVAKVALSVSWQRQADDTLRETELEQRWEETKGNWLLISEVQVGGDDGLLLPPPPPGTRAAAAPPPPQRPSYQTRVIYEAQ